MRTGGDWKGAGIGIRWGKKYARMRDFEDGERKEATIACRTDVGLCAETTYAIPSSQGLGWDWGRKAREPRGELGVSFADQTVISARLHIRFGRGSVP